MQLVTREFTGGFMKGQTFTEETAVAFTVGQVVEKAIGGSPYIITKVGPVWSAKEKLDHHTAYHTSGMMEVGCQSCTEVLRRAPKASAFRGHYPIFNTQIFVKGRK